MERNFSKTSLGCKASFSRRQICYMRYRYYYSTFSFSFISKDTLSAACSTLWEAVRFLLASHSDLWLLQNCDNESDMYGDFSLAWISEQWSCWPWWPQVSQYFPWGGCTHSSPPTSRVSGHLLHSQHGFSISPRVPFQSSSQEPGLETLLSYLCECTAREHFWKCDLQLPKRRCSLCCFLSSLTLEWQDCRCINLNI